MQVIGKQMRWQNEACGYVAYSVISSLNESTYGGRHHIARESTPAVGTGRDAVQHCAWCTSRMAGMHPESTGLVEAALLPPRSRRLIRAMRGQVNCIL